MIYHSNSASRLGRLFVWRPHKARLFDVQVGRPILRAKLPVSQPVSHSKHAGRILAARCGGTQMGKHQHVVKRANVDGTIGFSV